MIEFSFFMTRDIARSECLHARLYQLLALWIHVRMNAEVHVVKVVQPQRGGRGPRVVDPAHESCAVHAHVIQRPRQSKGGFFRTTQLHQYL